MRKRLVRSALGMIVALSGVAATPGPPQEAARNVRVTRPTRGPIERRTQVTADIVPIAQATLFSRIDGYLREVAVEEGDRARAGDLLAALDVPEVDAELGERQAELAEAQSLVAEGEARAEALAAERGVAGAELEVARKVSVAAQAVLEERDKAATRVRALHEAKAASDEELEQVEASLQGARAQAARAESQIQAAQARVEAAGASVREAKAHAASLEARERTCAARLARSQARRGFAEVRMPYAEGVVTRRLVHPGVLARDGETALLEVADVTRVRVRLAVPEAEARFVRPGTAAVAHLPGAAGPIETRVTRVAGSLDHASRTMRAEIVLENPEHRLLPGSYVTVDLILRSKADALSLPATALVSRSGSTFVWVVRDGVVQRVEVAVGLDDGLRVEIVSGLKGNETVVLGGGSGLNEGDRVTRVPMGARP